MRHRAPPKRLTRCWGDRGRDGRGVKAPRTSKKADAAWVGPARVPHLKMNPTGPEGAGLRMERRRNAALKHRATPKRLTPLGLGRRE